ncbi:hypothetical protein [Nostoc sp.]|uniref:hypothetical protein n=1 Tax=Nostoc sp. TaxID=1180 RepID=UPI002FF48D78
MISDEFFSLGRGLSQKRLGNNFTWFPEKAILIIFDLAARRQSLLLRETLREQVGTRRQSLDKGNGNLSSPKGDATRSLLPRRDTMLPDELRAKNETPLN